MIDNCDGLTLLDEAPAAGAVWVWAWHPSPLGDLLIAGTREGNAEHLRIVRFPEGSMAMQPDPAWTEVPDAFGRVRAQLDEYFAGERRTFELDLAPVVTPFQRRVLEALARIPYGETVSYGEIARELGQPGASRAVGAANGANPIPVILPCHRVVGSDGSLTGFGGGLPAKRFLLGLEQGNSGLFS